MGGRQAINNILNKQYTKYTKQYTKCTQLKKPDNYLKRLLACFQFVFFPIMNSATRTGHLEFLRFDF